MHLTIKDMHEDERPRERLMRHGVKTLGNAELLAIILGMGNKRENVLTLSNRILREYELANIPRVSATTLKQILGIGTAKACQLLASLELGRRIASHAAGRQVKLRSTKDVVKLLRPELKTLTKEHFLGIFLDSRNKVLKKTVIFIGSLDATVVHPREVFQVAITESAAKVIVAHNHPSGDPRPSKADIRVTEQLVKSGEILGIELVDHIIIGGNAFCALREEGYCF